MTTANPALDFYASGDVTVREFVFDLHSFTTGGPRQSKPSRPEGLGELDEIASRLSFDSWQDIPNGGRIEVPEGFFLDQRPIDHRVNPDAPIVIVGDQSTHLIFWGLPTALA